MYYSELILFDFFWLRKGAARIMSHRVYIGDYKKCKKKEGCSYVLDVESKALIECNCVSVV